MATKKSPLQTMTEKFGGKEALVDRVLSVLHFAESERDAVKSRLLAASNKKLLRLFEVASEVKARYGSPDKLAEAVAQMAGRAKDAPYIAKLTRLAERTPARVLDLIKGGARGAGGAAP